MVNWESKGDRGGRTPNRGRSQRGQRQPYTAPPQGDLPPSQPSCGAETATEGLTNSQETGTQLGPGLERCHHSGAGSSGTLSLLCIFCPYTHGIFTLCTRQEPNPTPLRHRGSPTGVAGASSGVLSILGFPSRCVPIGTQKPQRPLVSCGGASATPILGSKPSLAPPGHDRTRSAVSYWQLILAPPSAHLSTGRGQSLWHH